MSRFQQNGISMGVPIRTSSEKWRYGMSLVALVNEKGINTMA